jgi:hypothetical protein
VSVSERFGAGGQTTLEVSPMAVVFKTRDTDPPSADPVS